MPKPDVSPYPLAYGVEEETNVAINGTVLTSTSVGLMMMECQPREYAYPYLRYMRNGSRGYADQYHPEFCTPECTTPEQVVPYTMAGEQFLIGTVSNYLASNWPSSKAVINRRVVDSENNTIGCHDNFGLYERSLEILDGRGAGLMARHFITRSIITGAGYASAAHGPLFSQKANSVSDVMGGNVTGSRLFNVEGYYSGITARYEVRSSDINISPWATWMRLGSSALAISLAQTPLNRRYETIFDNRILEALPAHNAMPLNKDGTLRNTPELQTSIGFQQRMAEDFLGSMTKYASTPPEDLVNVARELYAFCDDMRAVVRSGGPIISLSNRADWAAKFSMITGHISRHPNSSRRRINDRISQGIDQLYDRITIHTDEAYNPLPPEYGTGYQLRDVQQSFHHSVPESEVSHALRNAPEGTRAQLRAKLLAKYQIAHLDWNKITIHARDDNTITINTGDVLKTKLSDEEGIALQERALLLDDD